MNNKSDHSLSPVEIARLALNRIAERGLPPTPENYTLQYRAVAGCAPLLGPDMAQELQAILDLVSQSTEELSTGVSRFQNDTGHMLEDLDATQEKQALACLLRAFTVATLSLHQTVDASRRELHETRRQLDDVTTELKRSEELARTDPLTGLCNRRAMGEIVARETARARRNSIPFSIAILDIDHFKKINDTHGHAAGDKALTHVALVVKSGLREADVICRYGGEEFMVLLPATPVAGARFVIDRLRVMVERTPLVLENDRVTIHFSAGVVEFRVEDSLEELLERADQALYEAKRTGRNCVVVSTSDLVSV